MNDVVYSIKVLKLLGIKNILITNSSGGINENYNVGDIIYEIFSNKAMDNDDNNT